MISYVVRKLRKIKGKKAQKNYPGNGMGNITRNLMRKLRENSTEKARKLSCAMGGITKKLK